MFDFFCLVWMDEKDQFNNLIHLFHWFTFFPFRSLTKYSFIETSSPDPWHASV